MSKEDIGVGVKPPEKECDDANCPWHGKIPVRGRVFQGSVRSAKSHSTVIVEWKYHRFVPKYERYERSKSRVPAHNPPCMHAREGDLVVIAECRPISKTKHFIVVAKLGKAQLEVAGEEQTIAMREKPKEGVKKEGSPPRKEERPAAKKPGPRPAKEAEEKPPEKKEEAKPGEKPVKGLKEGMPEKGHNLKKGTKRGFPKKEAKR